MVTLINRLKRMRTYNLWHPQHRKVLKFLKATPNKRGEPVLSRQVKEIGDSLTFAAKGTKGSIVSGLPDTILECEEIAAAVKRGDLAKQVKADPPTAKVKVPPAPSASKAEPATADAEPVTKPEPKKKTTKKDSSHEQ